MCILSEQRRWSWSSSSLSMSLSLPLYLRSPGACAPVAPFRHNEEQRGQCHCSALAQPSGHSHVRVVVRKQHRGELAFLIVPNGGGATYTCWEPNRMSWLPLSLRVAWASLTAGHLCSNPHPVPPFPPPLSDCSCSPLHLYFAFHLCSLGEPSHFIPQLSHWTCSSKVLTESLQPDLTNQTFHPWCHNGVAVYLKIITRKKRRTKQSSSVSFPHLIKPSFQQVRRLSLWNIVNLDFKTNQERQEKKSICEESVKGCQ